MNRFLFDSGKGIHPIPNLKTRKTSSFTHLQNLTLHTWKMMIETVLDFPFEMVPFFRGELLNFGGIAPMILFPSTKSLAKDRCCSCDLKITTAWPAVQWKETSRCFWIWKLRHTFLTSGYLFSHWSLGKKHPKQNSNMVVFTVFTQFTTVTPNPPKPWCLLKVSH